MKTVGPLALALAWELPVIKIQCSRCGKEFSPPMPELPADGFNLCSDCTKFLGSSFLLWLRTKIRNWL